ncbi:MAG: ion transporter [Candidatus Electrothrix sp. AR5]|nr:ion transporter [Candidatus Electrothrix sp. AR5]
MDKLREIILESDTRKGKLFDIAIQLLIAISLISISLETLPDLERKTYLFLATIENVIAVIFTIEYLLRIILTEKKTSYVFSFYGIIDLLAILPFYVSGSVTFQTLRVLRFLRLFRILKLTRYTDAISRIWKAILIAKEELVLFSIVTLMLLYLSAVGIYHFEHAAQPENYKSLFDCLWWAVATLTTVGYGDIYPITIGGRLFTFVILMLGLGVVTVPTGVIASALSAVRKSE